MPKLSVRVSREIRDFCKLKIILTSSVLYNVIRKIYIPFYWLSVRSIIFERIFL